MPSHPAGTLLIAHRKHPNRKPLIIHASWWNTKPPYYDNNYKVIGEDGAERHVSRSSLWLPDGVDNTIVTPVEKKSEPVSPVNEEAVAVEDEDPIVFSEAELNVLTWQEFKTYAADRGVNTKKKKRAELMDELRDLGMVGEDEDE